MSLTARTLAGAATVALGAWLALPRQAGAQLAVLTNLVEERTATPGDRYTGRITVRNTSAQPQSARIYQTDFQFAADGTSHTDDPGTSPRSNAPWVHPQTTRLTIPPNAEVSVPYTVDVPKSDSLRGTYWSTIMVEGTPSPAQAMQVASGELGIGIGSVVRYAVQIATHIGGGGTRTLQFSDIDATRNTDGSAAIQFDVLDTGERGYRPTLWIEVYDENGALSAKGRRVRGLLYPGTSLRQHFDLGALARGHYKVLIFADTGVEPTFAAQFTAAF
jgi:hypothetical protein